MNSREKGKRGELQWRDELSANGYHARRGQQFSGGADSPDVVCDELEWLHIEVKRTQALNLTAACAQAEGDCGGKPWIVAHRRNHAPWLITMTAEVFFRFLRGDLPPESNNNINIKPHTDTKHEN
jgi:Holliday junction resolvase